MMNRCLKCRKKIENGSLWCDKHREILDVFEKIKIFKEKEKRFYKSERLIRLEARLMKRSIQ
jgi:hypothetical protein